MHAMDAVTSDVLFGDDVGGQFDLASLSQSMIVEELSVEVIEAAQVLDYDDLVRQGRALYPSDIARFDCPDLEDPIMLWGNAEYFRWYTADGLKREAPLDYDELVELVQFRDQCSMDAAEREVSLNSRARKGDKELWKKVVQFGYADWTREFAEDEKTVF